MFVQVMQGQLADAAALRSAVDQWMRDLAPGAQGWLGTTAGVTDDGTFLAGVRFASPEAARRNSDRPEQGQWWAEASKAFAGEVSFFDCRDVDQVLGGGSDDAGFVQVMQGRVRDEARARELTKQMEPLIRQARPDLIGAIIAAHGDGVFTQFFYFTSEEAAREGERSEPPPEAREQMEEMQSLLEEEVRYYDLREPWLYSP